jgi:hypothetical protein
MSRTCRRMGHPAAWSGSRGRIDDACGVRAGIARELSVLALSVLALSVLWATAVGGGPSRGSGSARVYVGPPDSRCIGSLAGGKGARAFALHPGVPAALEMNGPECAAVDARRRENGVVVPFRPGSIAPGWKGPAAGWGLGKWQCTSDCLRSMRIRASCRFLCAHVRACAWTGGGGGGACVHVCARVRSCACICSPATCTSGGGLKFERAQIPVHMPDPSSGTRRARLDGLLSRPHLPARWGHPRWGQPQQRHLVQEGPAATGEH